MNIQHVLNILRWDVYWENIHVFYFYYHSLTVTTFAVMWLDSDTSSYRIYINPCTLLLYFHLHQLNLSCHCNQFHLCVITADGSQQTEFKLAILANLCFTSHNRDCGSAWKFVRNIITCDRLGTDIPVMYKLGQMSIRLSAW